ncbi:hypothetical protein LPJ57_001538 [Coemansia sp. RSA 486]|nr:hypothetical protein LPJ57_001538 [Coemansia sp. RSA 486]KAJ2231372.1 hypothetical protein IWW45_005493 [Coemansia sp. RSA 485]
MSDFIQSPVHSSNNSGADRQDEIPSPETPPHLRGQPFLSDLVNNSTNSRQQPLDTQRIHAYIASSQQQQQHGGYSEDEKTDDDGNEGEAEFNPGFEFQERELSVPGLPKAVVRQRERWWKRMVLKSNWKSTMRFVGLYMALPFVTGVMAGLGEIFANEVMYRWGWRGARPIQVPGRDNRVFPVTKEKVTVE